MDTETKAFKLYEEYRKIPFNKISNMEKYVTKRGQAIISFRFGLYFLKCYV